MPSAWVDWREFGPTEGEDLVVVQAKASQLAMPLLGQAMFSPLLAQRYLGPSSVRSVLLCTASDEDLAPLAIEHGVEVVVQPEFGHARPWRLGADRTALAAWAEHEGGEAIFDFPLTHPRPGASGQTAHLVLLPDRPSRVRTLGRGTILDADCRVAGERVVVVTATGRGLGMSALGQAWCCARLLELHHEPASVRSVVLAVRDDEAIGKLASEMGIEVVVAKCPPVA